MASSGSGLEHLLAEGVITEVLARLQSGKEAEVYVVRFGGKVVAAKVYKDRAQRSFKNNALYKEGRAVRNTRSQRAMARGSSFGKAAAEDAWKTAEADALYKLHAAEVRVPTPVLYLDGVLLMELVLDAQGNAAPRLIDTQLTAPQANAAYHDMLGQLVRILSCDLIHGDLSPYNVLWGSTGPTIIDFPQIVSASHNSSSEQFFLRDADNILGFFARIDRSLLARRGDPREIWNAYRRRELQPDFRPTGQARPAYPQQQRAFVPQHRDQSSARGAHGPSRPNEGPPQRGQNGPRAGGNGAANGGQRRGPPNGGRRGMSMPEVIVRPSGGAPSQMPASVAPPPQAQPQTRPPQEHATANRAPQDRAPHDRPRQNDAVTTGPDRGDGQAPAHRRRRRRR